MHDQRPIQPIAAFNASPTIPGSKSLTNRALLLAALAQGESVVSNVLLADDSRHMLAALADLGFSVQRDGTTCRITGQAGRIPNPDAKLFLGNAGTAYRFLTAACCLPPTGQYALAGIPRMHERPIGQLVEPLQQLGADIAYLDQPGFPPLRISARSLSGGELNMTPTLSSQYISALLQIAPCCEQGITLNFRGPITSRPYVAMTLGLMRLFGVTAETNADLSRIHVPSGRYRATQYHVEPDASNASYFLAAAAIVPGSRCTIEGLGKASLQGDVGFADVLARMGAGLVFGDDFITAMSPPQGQRLRGIDVDLNHMPDMAQTLAVTALHAAGATHIRNVGNLRVKETDRIAALQTELTKLGASVTVDGDDLHISPPGNNQITPPPPPGGIDTYDDHRMAMSFALAGLRQPGVVINDPSCVNKTFPEFFDVLDQLASSSQ